MTQSNPFAIAVVPAGTAPPPSYLSAMVLHRWYKLSGSAPDLGLSPTNVATDVAGSFAPFGQETEGIWEAWNGFALCTKHGASGQLFAWGGGHGANEWPGFIVWDIATRTWQRDARGVPGSTTVSNGLYSTGAPVPPHTYFGAHVRTLTGEIVQPNSETSPGDPASKRVGFRRYQPATGVWSGGPIQFGTSVGSGISAVYDPELDRSIVVTDSGRYIYNHATETFGTFTWPALNSELPSTLLPKNGVRAASYMIAIGSWSGSSTPNPFVFFRVDSPNSSARIFANPIGAHPQHASGDTPLLYSPGSDSIYVLGADPSGLGTLYRYPCPSTIPGTWTGSSIALSFESPMENFIQSNSQGGDRTRNKAQLAVFSTGAEMVVLSGWPTQAVYGMRLR